MVTKISPKVQSLTAGVPFNFSCTALGASPLVVYNWSILERTTEQKPRLHYVRNSKEIDQFPMNFIAAWEQFVAESPRYRDRPQLLAGVPG